MEVPVAKTLWHTGQVNGALVSAMAFAYMISCCYKDTISESQNWNLYSEINGLYLRLTAPVDTTYPICL